MAAPNKRFGVMRGVCSQKVLREFESFAPVRAFAFPRPNAKPPTVMCHRQKRILKKKNEKFNLHIYIDNDGVQQPFGKRNS